MARTSNKDYPKEPWRKGGPRVYAYQVWDMNQLGPFLAERLGLLRPPSQADVFDACVQALYNELGVERVDPPSRPDDA